MDLFNDIGMEVFLVSHEQHLQRPDELLLLGLADRADQLDLEMKVFDGAQLFQQRVDCDFEGWQLRLTLELRERFKAVSSRELGVYQGVLQVEDVYLFFKAKFAVGHGLAAVDTHLIERLQLEAGPDPWFLLRPVYRSVPRWLILALAATGPLITVASFIGRRAGEVDVLVVLRLANLREVVDRGEWPVFLDHAQRRHQVVVALDELVVPLVRLG